MPTSFPGFFPPAPPNIEGKSPGNEVDILQEVLQIIIQHIDNKARLKRRKATFVSPTHEITSCAEYMTCADMEYSERTITIFGQTGTMC